MDHTNDLPEWWPHDKPYAIQECLGGMKDIPDESVDIVVTDPPYNLHKLYGGKMTDKYGEYFNDSKPDEIYWSWLKRRMEQVYRILKKPGFLYISHSDSGIYKLKPILSHIGFNFVQNLYWVGKNGYGQYNKTRWSYRVEPILFMVKDLDYELYNGPGQKWYTSNLEFSRPQSNFKEGRHHITQKPIKLYDVLISRTPGDIVFDPFLGSGTSIVAAMINDRTGLGFELMEKNDPIIQKRINKQRSMGRLMWE